MLIDLIRNYIINTCKRLNIEIYVEFFDVMHPFIKLWFSYQTIFIELTDYRASDVNYGYSKIYNLKIEDPEFFQKLDKIIEKHGLSVL